MKNTTTKTTLLAASIALLGTQAHAAVIPGGTFDTGATLTEKQDLLFGDIDTGEYISQDDGRSNIFDDAGDDVLQMGNRMVVTAFTSSGGGVLEFELQGYPLAEVVLESITVYGVNATGTPDASTVVLDWDSGNWSDNTTDFTFTQIGTKTDAEGVGVYTVSLTNPDSYDFLLLSIDHNDNDDKVYLDDIGIVPEPGSLALLALGGLAVMRRRRRA